MNKRIVELLREGADVTEELLELMADETDNEYSERYSKMLDRIQTDFEFLKGHYELGEMIRQNPELGNKKFE